jgi:hypothetical protein
MPKHRFVARAVVIVFAAGASMTFTVPALAADATTVVVTSPAALVWGQSLMATVTDSANMTSVPSGTLQFRDNGAPIGASVPLIAGAGSLLTPSLEVAQLHTISAVYTPSDLNLFMASTSADLPVTVGKAATSTTLTAAPNPAVAGQDTTFAATVGAQSPGAGTPSGNVEFADAAATFAAIELDPTGHASTVAYAFAGLYTVSAHYVGDPHFNDSFGSVNTRVDKAATNTTLTISPNPATPGATITYTAIVSVPPPGDVDPAGSLQFAIDGAPVGAAIGLGGGVIGFQGSLTAPPGNRTYLVAVSYSGDDDTQPSSASVAVTVAAPAPAPAPAVAGSAASTAPLAPATLAVARLNAMTSTLTTALRLRGFAALGATTERLTAPGPGLLEQKVYSPAVPHAARAAATKPVMIASARRRFTAAGAGTLRLKLTSAGRRAMRHVKSLKLAIVTRFTPATGKAVLATKHLTVRAKPKRSARGRAGAARGWRLVGVRLTGRRSSPRPHVSGVLMR